MIFNEQMEKRLPSIILLYGFKFSHLTIVSNFIIFIIKLNYIFAKLKKQIGRAKNIKYLNSLNKQSINSKTELQLKPTVQQILTLFQMDNE